MAKEIDDLRQKIEEVDNLIFNLLNKRKDIVSKINLLKIKENISIFDKTREQDLFIKYSSWLKDNYYHSIFNSILHAGKHYLRPYKIGLIGSDISQSLSPKVHLLISQLTNTNYEFQLLEINPTSFNLDEIKNYLISYEFNALFVTMPYKERITKICDLITTAAHKAQNVNLIYYDGKNIIGDNTDGIGFTYSFAKYKTKLINHQPFILGNGMASKTVSNCLIEMGFKTPIIVSHNPNDKHQIDYQMLAELLPTFVINATPVGTGLLESHSLLDNVDTSKLDFVFDLLYNPQVTKTMAKAVSSQNGLEMLVVQAIVGIEKIFHKQLLTDKLVKEIINKILQ